MVVRAYAPPLAKEVGTRLPDCSLCRRPENRRDREAWGCDAPADRTVFTTGCSRCFGADPECPTCDDGVVSYDSCPTSVIQAAPQATQRGAAMAFNAYQQFDERGVLPSAGGMLDQTPQLRR